MLSLFFGSHTKSFKISKEPLVIFDPSLEIPTDTLYKVSAKGLGEVIIGANLDLPVLRDKVKIILDSDKNLFDMHEILSFFKSRRSVESLLL